jgi:predicted LPLAT superfamily acyltransferase
MSKPAASPSTWLEHRERGSVGAIRAMSWAARKFGRTPTRLLLYPIVGYFLIRGGSALQASRDYLRRSLDRPPRWRDVFRQHHAFASTILDRVYLLAGETARFDVKIHGMEVFDRAFARGQGLIMFGAHFGSFDILRCLAEHHNHLPVNILMHEGNSAKLQAVLGALAPNMRERIVPLGQPDTFLRVKELLDAGEVVGLLADRGLDGDKRVQVPFLGGSAYFPIGPMLLASILRAPVLLFFAVYRGGNRYDIYFDEFADSVAVDRRQREVELKVWVERYARALELRVRDAPYNWFNFYPFWTDKL